MPHRIPGLQFEMERRVILFKSTTSMPDGTQLGYNGNPNAVINGATSGQTLIYMCPVGTRYQEDNGNQWFKRSLPNIWEQFGGSGGTSLTEVDGEFYTWSSKYNSNVSISKKNFIYSLSSASGQFLSINGKSWNDSSMGFRANKNGFIEINHNIDDIYLTHNIDLHIGSNIINTTIEELSFYPINQNDLLRIFIPPPVIKNCIINIIFISKI